MYDVIGNIAIVQKRDKTLIKNILNNRHVQSVFLRGKLKGKLRIPDLKWLAGKRNYETLHKESGCVFKVNIKKCFFSPRLANDRMAIAKKIKPGEKVLVMFSGIGPYPIIISKHSKASKIYSIELGKKAVDYAIENLKLNKVMNVSVIHGDVKKIAPKIKEKFDRILMPRPQLKETFLKEAFKLSKKGTIIHYYDFMMKRNIHEIIDIVEAMAKKYGKKIKIIDLTPIREIAPYKYNVRLDFKII